MKKAKIMVTAIAILAVVGGALAFKARTFSFETLYITSGTAGVCDKKVTTLTRNDDIGALRYASTTSAGTCTQIKVTNTEQ